MAFEDDVLVVQASRGDEFHISSAVRDRVVDERASLMISDAMSDDALKQRQSIVMQGVHSLMAVPLVVHDTKKDEEGRQPLPLIALRRYGKGTVVFVGLDETWRFRKEVGDTYHRTFWAQAVQHLGPPRGLLGQRQTVQLITGDGQPAVGQGQVADDRRGRR